MKFDKEIVEILRRELVPKGTLPVVRLAFRTNNAFYDYDFVKRCIAEMAKMPLYAAIGKEPSALEQLAIQLLLESAGIQYE